MADTAVVVGDVEVGDDSSIWFNAVVRGDAERVRLGCETNVQDNVVVHADEGFPCDVGSRVTIGHSAVVHGCRVADNVLVGMGAVILNGSEIGEYSLVGAGAVVAGGRYPARSLILGVPARVVRALTDSEVELIERGWRAYVQLKERYLRGEVGANPNKATTR